MMIGSNYHGSGKTSFFLWAPFQKKIMLNIVSPEERSIEMTRDKKESYWYLYSEDIDSNSCYYYKLDNGKNFPDPASCYQPEGVHGPSQIVNHNFDWDDENWPGIPLHEMVIYELHVGTFTPQGNFEAIISRLDELANLGINTLELMPVAQFSGKRNWGYDGVYPFAVQNSYGSPNSLKKLVNACHMRNMSILLDVVYNHLGPEGNYLPEFGPYFTEKYHTNWGVGINFDGPFSDDVKNYFIQNALYWLEKYHFDGLRLDAIHGIFDISAKHFLADLGSKVNNFSQKKNKKYYLIAESDLNDNKVIRSRYRGGYQMDAQWNDDYHHSLHTLLTGEKSGYYQDFGKMEHLGKAIKEGFVYSGQYSSFRKKSHGNSSRFIPTNQFIVYSQNHDQIGNRMLGERLSNLISTGALKLSAAMTILSPYIPLIFMGEEYGEKSPFLYFINHEDKNLINAVRKGRKKEFARFQWQYEPPDPQDEKTFTKSKINWANRKNKHNAIILDFYHQLLQLRKKYSVLKCPDKKQVKEWHLEEKKILIQMRIGEYHQFLLLSNFYYKDIEYNFRFIKKFLIIKGKWDLVLDSCHNERQEMSSSTLNLLNKNQIITMKPFQFLLYKRSEI